MNKKDDFLRDFFKEQNLFQQKGDNNENKKSEEVKKGEGDDVKKIKNTKITRIPESQTFRSQKEINLRALFEGIEREEEEFINQFNKETDELQKKSEIKKQENINEENNQKKITEALQIQNIRLGSHIKKNEQKEKRKQKEILKKQLKNIPNIQKKYSEKFLDIISHSKNFAINNKIKFITPQLKTLPIKKIEKLSISNAKSILFKNKKLGSTIQNENNNNNNNKIISKPFSSVYKKQENKRIEKINTEINTEINNKKESIKITKKVKNTFIISRKGKKYLPDIWEKNPEIIPIFEVKKVLKSSENISDKNNKRTKLRTFSKNSFNNIKESLEKVSILGKKINKNIQKKSVEVLKTSHKAFKEGIKKAGIQRKKHIKSLQIEWDMYQEMMQNSGEKLQKKLSTVQKKSLEKISTFHKIQKLQIEKWKVDRKNHKKNQLELQIIEDKKREKKKEKLQIEKIRIKQEEEKDKLRIQEKKISEERKLKEKKIEEEKKIILENKENIISKFSIKKGILLNKLIPNKSAIKEWVQIGGMVASVFIIGVVGLRLPGFMSQYESVWNADFFTEQQESVSFLLGEKKNPFENIKSLPVAGNIINTKNKIDNNEFLNINPPDTRIVIPKIAKNIPILQIGDESRLSENWEKLEADIQEALKDGVVHYPGTALPGDDGNVFVTGHSSYYPWDSGRYKDVFAALHNLEVGDEYYIFHKGKKYKYIITTRKIVPPSDVSVLDQDHSKKESTLMTCTPVGTAKNRLILKAQQVAIEY